MRMPTTCTDVSSENLRKARLSARRAKTSSPCISCTAYGYKCSETRPCARCVKSSRNCVRVASIERVVVQTPNFLLLNPQASIPLFDCEIEWARLSLSRHVKMGYRITEIARSLSALTLEDRHNIDRALVHISLSHIPSDRAKSTEPCRSDRRDGFTATSVIPEQPSFPPFLLDRGGGLGDECGVGLMSIMFDPNSGHRRQLLVNLQQARNPFKLLSLGRRWVHKTVMFHNRTPNAQTFARHV